MDVTWEGQAGGANPRRSPTTLNLERGHCTPRRAPRAPLPAPALRHPQGAGHRADPRPPSPDGRASLRCDGIAWPSPGASVGAAVCGPWGAAGKSLCTCPPRPRWSPCDAASWETEAQA